MAEFKLPDLGEGVTEAEVDRWLVKEGDVIGEDDPLVEVITDKATAEIPSPYAGTVARIHVEAGAVVPVGTVLVTIGEAGADNVEVPDVQEDPIQKAFTRAPAGGESVPESNGQAIKAMPPVRKLARSLGIDLGGVRGTGPEGRILRTDVEAHATGSGAPVEAEPGRAGTGGRREPLRGVRRIVAERMSEAHRIVPPVTHVEECDVTELDATRRLANERSPELQKLTFMPFIVKAVVTALKNYPALNASLDEERSEIVFHDRYDIGIAVDTPAGLTVPVVRDADRKRLRDIAADIDRLASAARDGKLSRDELQGATFTVTSPGPFGGLMATPIVFYPQAAILGVHRAGERPVVRDGQIVARLMMNLSITFDHRVLDGMTAARFILDIVRLLEHPAVLALES
jgi:pyruvate/2-oxoglutarate dehydrogenase complex dihydrolipoamide acyltransferase (E2) component